MSIIEAVRNWFLTYPALDDPGVPLLVDYLGAEAAQYTLESVPDVPIYRQYTDGSCLMQYLFIFASREYYGAEVERCMDNQAFFEELAAWVRQQNRKHALPELGENRVPVFIEVLTGGYAFSEDSETARYQMQLRLVYEEN